LSRANHLGNLVQPRCPRDEDLDEKLRAKLPRERSEKKQRIQRRSDLLCRSTAAGDIEVRREQFGAHCFPDKGAPCVLPLPSQ
jgi:hypothetical protein